MEKIGLEFKNVSKIMGGNKILDNVSFSIPSGKITAFLGPNGAGKTTTMKMAANLFSITSGMIFINGKAITESNTDTFFIPDYPLVYPELTGEEYILFIKDLYNVKLDEKSLEILLEKFNIHSYINKNIAQYSLGMKKKLVLLSIFIIKPPLVLLDEYISGIDPINLKEIKDLLIEYTNEGNTVLLSTHQLEVAQTFCHNVVMINEGKIINSGTKVSSLVAQNESLESYFIMSLREGGVTQ